MISTQAETKHPLILINNFRLLNKDYCTCRLFTYWSTKVVQLSGLLNQRYNKTNRCLLPLLLTRLDSGCVKDISACLRLTVASLGISMSHSLRPTRYTFSPRMVHLSSGIQNTTEVLFIINWYNLFIYKVNDRLIRLSQRDNNIIVYSSFFQWQETLIRGYLQSFRKL